jgi:hypothetical protein
MKDWGYPRERLHTMQAAKLKKYTLVRIDGKTVHIQEVYPSHAGDLTVIDGKISGRGEVVSWVVADDENIPLCTWDGITIEGKLKCQVIAEEVKQRAEAAGWTVELNINNYGYSTSAVLWMTRGIDDDKYSVSWYTRTGSTRHTTGFGVCTKFRPYWAKKRTSMVKLTRKAFYSDLSLICWRAERGL